MDNISGFLDLMMSNGKEKGKSGFQKYGGGKNMVPSDSLSHFLMTGH